MSLSDPLGDMLTRIRNAQRARHAACVAPASKLRTNVLEALKREGYIRGFSTEEVRKGVSQLRIELKYVEGQPVIKEIHRVSKPGRRVYSKIKELPRVYRRPWCVDPVHPAWRPFGRRGPRCQCWRRGSLPRLLRRVACLA